MLCLYPRQVDALVVLDRMAEIVRNDMLVHRLYVSSDIVRPDLAEQGAVCGGRNACAVGALYLAAGVTLINADLDRPYLPGIEVDERAGFMVDKPALQLAYRALNAVAQQAIDHHGWNVGAWKEHGPLEALFESRDPRTLRFHIEPVELLPVIESAKQLVASPRGL